jgi:hypothetical protein
MEVLAARTEADVKRIVPELRLALREHIRLARESLTVRLSTYAALDAATQNNKKDTPD